MPLALFLLFSRLSSVILFAFNSSLVGCGMVRPSSSRSLGEERARGRPHPRELEREKTLRCVFFFFFRATRGRRRGRGERKTRPAHSFSTSFFCFFKSSASFFPSNKPLLSVAMSTLKVRSAAAAAVRAALLLGLRERELRREKEEERAIPAHRSMARRRDGVLCVFSPSSPSPHASSPDVLPSRGRAPASQELSAHEKHREKRPKRKR